MDREADIRQITCNQKGFLEPSFWGKGLKILFVEVNVNYNLRNIHCKGEIRKKIKKKQTETFLGCESS